MAEVTTTAGCPGLIRLGLALDVGAARREAALRVLVTRTARVRPRAYEISCWLPWPGSMGCPPDPTAPYGACFDNLGSQIASSTSSTRVLTRLGCAARRRPVWHQTINRPWSLPATWNRRTVPQGFSTCRARGVLHLAGTHESPRAPCRRNGATRPFHGPSSGRSAQRRFRPRTR